MDCRSAGGPPAKGGREKGERLLFVAFPFDFRRAFGDTSFCKP